MKRLFATLCALTLIAGFSSGCGSGSGQPKTAEIFAMDTVMDFTLYGDKAQSALDASEKKIDMLESLLSRTKESSEVSKLNAADGTPLQMDHEAYSLISRARDLGAATGSAFDITIAPVVSAWGFTTSSYQVPSQSTLDELLTHVGLDKIELDPGDTITLKDGATIDLGGIAKGYASDSVREIFLDHGIKSGMISLGGNVYVCGKKPDGSDWRVAVQDPNDSQSYVGVLSLSDAFAVTSGGYQRYFEQDGKRYHHIIDPSTGYPAESGLTSVTVVASADAPGDSADDTGSGTMCDAFSTALFVMGEKRAIQFWHTGEYSFGMVLVTSDGRVLVTSDLAGEFEKTEGSGYTYDVIS